MYTSEFPIIDVTVDAVVFFTDEQHTLSESADVLTIVRGQDPYKGAQALPGGFMEVSESALTSCIREVWEETGVNLHHKAKMSSLIARTKPDRDPRKRIISIPFGFIMPRSAIRTIKAGDDAASATATPLASILERGDAGMAFDHYEIVCAAYAALSHPS